METHFLASYPRSGNTWARVMLYHAIHARGGETPSTREIASMMPDLHVEGEVERSLEANPDEGLLVKTHFPHSPTHAHLERAAGAVVLVRHPRDVLMSCLRFHRVLETKVKDRRTGRDASLQPIDYARNFIRLAGDPVWANQGFATWEQCTASWLDAELPTILVRYEDMLDEPHRELGRVLEFLGESRDNALIERAVASASFDRMRALEVGEKSRSTKKNTFFGGSQKTVRKGIYFMDRARRGSSLEGIQPGLDDAFDERFADGVRRFGYE